jgi:hypothetical protein
VLHDRAAVQFVEVAAKLARRARCGAQQIQDLAARRMTERPEDAVLLVESSYNVIIL